MKNIIIELEKKIKENENKIKKIYGDMGKEMYEVYRETLSTRYRDGGATDVDKDYFIGITLEGWVEYSCTYISCSGVGRKPYIEDENEKKCLIEDIEKITEKNENIKKAILEKYKIEIL